MNSGRVLQGHPCLGSWVNYGLGTLNENLPGFVVMLDPRGGPIAGAANWMSGYMPAAYQGTVLRSTGRPILNLARHPNRPDRQKRRWRRSMRSTPSIWPRARAIRSCRREFPLMSWRSNCSRRPPKRSTCRSGNARHARTLRPSRSETIAQICRSAAVRSVGSVWSPGG